MAAKIPFASFRRGSSKKQQQIAEMQAAMERMQAALDEKEEENALMRVCYGESSNECERLRSALFEQEEENGVLNAALMLAGTSGSMKRNTNSFQRGGSTRQSKVSLRQSKKDVIAAVELKTKVKVERLTGELVRIKQENSRLNDCLEAACREVEEGTTIIGELTLALNSTKSERDILFNTVEKMSGVKDLQSTVKDHKQRIDALEYETTGYPIGIPEDGGDDMEDDDTTNNMVFPMVAIYNV